MRKYVVIINGSGGVGKDTFIDFVREIVPVDNYSSVSKVKDIARLIGWDGGKTERDRKFLSDLKLLTTAYNEMPLRSMIERLEIFLKSNDLILFLHVREPEEIEKLKRFINDNFKYVDVRTVLITRKTVAPITSNMADANVLNYDYNFVIENDGTLDELKIVARRFLNYIDLKEAIK